MLPPIRADRAMLSKQKRRESNPNELRRRVADALAHFSIEEIGQLIEEMEAEIRTGVPSPVQK